MTLLNVSTRKVNAIYFCSTSARPLIRSMHTPDSIISYNTMVLMDLSYCGLNPFYLADPSSYVVLEDKNSLSTKVLSGVPQGTVLAPLLFLLYINDLPACVNNKVKLYADDVLLYSSIESESDCIALQEDLDKLIEWSDKWLMDFNLKKCEHLRITNKHSPVIYSYFLGNTVITEVIHTKYLGVTFDQKLSWNEHIQRISSKANQV